MKEKTRSILMTLALDVVAFPLFLVAFSFVMTLMTYFILEEVWRKITRNKSS